MLSNITFLINKSTSRDQFLLPTSVLIRGIFSHGPLRKTALFLPRLSLGKGRTASATICMRCGSGGRQSGPAGRQRK